MFVLGVILSKVTVSVSDKIILDRCGIRQSFDFLPKLDVVFAQGEDLFAKRDNAFVC
jgi:hypothetical protein